MHLKSILTLLLISCFVCNVHGQACGGKYADCMMEILGNQDFLDLVQTILDTEGNLPNPVEEYREVFCGASKDIMACASTDGEACYAVVLKTMNEPSDPTTVITGSDGKSIHAIDDCDI